MIGKSLNQIREVDWDYSTAKHLLNRAGFGVPENRISELLKMSPSDAVDSFLDVEDYLTLVKEPGFIPAPLTAEDRSELQALPPEERREKRLAHNRLQNQANRELQDFWLSRMGKSSAPLAEKMALFWHGHFATSFAKVQTTKWNYQIYEVFLRHGLGSFRTLVNEVSKSPAMIEFLDQNRNNRQRPNENFARELMELFTLGEGQYTEQDVKEAARAFSGHTHFDGNFQFRRNQHDNGQKTFMGQTGNFRAQDILDIIFQQPALPRFIATKFWHFFVSENPHPQRIEELAAEFRNSNFSIRHLLRTIFLSEVFYSTESRGCLIKSPVQFLIMLSHQLNIGFYERPFARNWLINMGQQLFRPPNVKGWPGGRDWINTNTMLARWNLSAFLITGRLLRDFSEAEDEIDENLMMMGANQSAPDPTPGRRPPFNPRLVFHEFNGLTPTQTIQALESAFLSQPLNDVQKDTFIRLLFKDNARVFQFHVNNMDDYREVIHLLTSLAEFQLV